MSKDVFALLLKSKPKDIFEEHISENPSDYVNLILDGLNHDNQKVQHGCYSIATFITEREPELLYPHIELFLSNLDTNKPKIRWDVICTIGNLANVDKAKKIVSHIPKISQFIDSDSAILQWCVVDALTKIAVAHPDTTRDILQLYIDHSSDFIKNRVGFLIEAMEQFLDHEELIPTIRSFVEGYLTSDVKVVAKKSKRVLKKIEKVESK